MAADLERFFRDYADSYTRALGDPADIQRLRACFADCYVAAGPEGVICGQNDAVFGLALERGYGFYRSIRARAMAFVRVEVTPIDDGHAMARVCYRGDYRRPTGEPLTIESEVTYLLQTAGGTPKIFAVVAGDEMGVYRRHGLVDEDGQAVA
jgi:hypothetical protein